MRRSIAPLVPTSTTLDVPDAPKTGAEEVRWNLNDLYADTNALEADLARADDLAAAYADRYRGRLNSLQAPALATAMKDLAAIQDMLGRAYTFAYLNWSTATEDTARGALLQHVKEAYTQTVQRLIFFDVEWAAVDAEKAEYLLQDKALAPYRHYLELQQLQKDHLLSEPEEKILAEKSITGRSAWTRFFDETLGRARFEFQGESLPEQAVLAKLHEPARAVRKEAALSLTDGFVRLEHPLTYAFNTVLADKASSDRMRGYTTWIQSRNLANEIQDASVQALIDAVTGRYDVAQRYYRLKARLLGLDGEGEAIMMDYDRYAPLPQTDDADNHRYTWNAARSLVTDAYGDFHDEMGTIVTRFFDERWIDAPPVAGKRGGAFSHGAVPSAHPYILMNYTGRVRDVQTLAHELGHGVHQYLSRGQGVFHADTPLTTAETASVFGEMLVFQRLIGAETAPQRRLAMLVQKIDDSMATVYRQVSMNRFEDAIHTHRRNQGELTPEQFAEHWMTTQSALYGDSVTLGEHYRRWWSYIPHFVHTPGYVYAYAFGELLVLALYARYLDEGEAFPPKYRALLAAGGSDWPHVLVGRLGIDLEDPAFWQQGLDALDALVAEAEGEAATLGV
ncbi:MAG: M3 family oligoendopeptidase [Bacteroidota bacterium]